MCRLLIPEVSDEKTARDSVVWCYRSVANFYLENRGQIPSCTHSVAYETSWWIGYRHFWWLYAKAVFAHHRMWCCITGRILNSSIVWYKKENWTFTTVWGVLQADHKSYLVYNIAFVHQKKVPYCFGSLKAQCLCFRIWEIYGLH